MTPHAYRRHPAAPLRGRERGQVLIWFLAFAATLAVVFAGVYSVGQVTSEKQKVVNAADAAAYSGGLVEARALNLTSYTNRSIIANEVLIAQMVSLDSWTSYFERATDMYQKEANALSAVPYVGVAFKILATTLKIMNQLVSPLAKVVDNTVPTVITLWETAYKVWYRGAIWIAFQPPTMALAVNSTASGVLAQNKATQGGRLDTAPRLLHGNEMMLRNQLSWGALTKYYEKSGTPGTASDGRKIHGDLLLASLDDFSRDRPGSSIFPISMMFGDARLCIPGVFMIGSDKRGPTRLVNYERWEAQDTVEFKVGVPGRIDCDWDKLDGIPQGWGRATADQRGTRGNRFDNGNPADTLAYKNNHGNRGWSGVKNTFDVERDANGKPKKEESIVTVVAGKPGSAVKTNESLGFMNRPMTGPTGSPDLKAGFAKDQIAAISEARVFFERPQRNARDITGGSLFRADSFKEYASLYNPYWQVRLSEPDSNVRKIIYGLDGINPLIETFAQ